MPDKQKNRIEFPNLTYTHLLYSFVFQFIRHNRGARRKLFFAVSSSWAQWPLSSWDSPYVTLISSMVEVYIHSSFRLLCPQFWLRNGMPSCEFQRWLHDYFYYCFSLPPLVWLIWLSLDLMRRCKAQLKPCCLCLCIIDQIGMSLRAKNHQSHNRQDETKAQVKSEREKKGVQFSPEPSFIFTSTLTLRTLFFFSLLDFSFFAKLLVIKDVYWYVCMYAN